MSSMDVLLPFTTPACDSGPPPCSSPMLPPKSPCAKAARLLNDFLENCMMQSRWLYLWPFRARFSRLPVWARRERAPPRVWENQKGSTEAGNSNDG